MILYCLAIDGASQWADIEAYSRVPRIVWVGQVNGIIRRSKKDVVHATYADFPPAGIL